MTLFTNIFIENLFNFSYPKNCTNWNQPSHEVEKTDFGKYLKEFSNGINELENAKKINIILNNNSTESEIKKQIEKYRQLKNERRENIIKSNNNYFFTLKPILNLSNENDEVWGSKRQYLSGFVLSEIFKKNNINLPPYMCCALNPTGGICGAGNTSLYKGTIDSPLIIHSCMHDASGYCYQYHNMGSGYNYLNSYFSLPTFSPRSGQISGILTSYYINFFK